MKHTENKFTDSLRQSVTLICVMLSLTITNPLFQEGGKLLLEVSQQKMACFSPSKD